MLTKDDIQRIIDECREAGSLGLGRGSRAIIDELHVDFLIPPLDFLGVSHNPAIFINHDTYALLGRYHPTWEVNKTIAVKESFLDKKPSLVIGIIVHEMGHAFNVAAGLINSEANACIFEIEVISLWFATKNPALFNCTRDDLHAFFESRLPYYRAEALHSDYLAALVKRIEKNEILDPTEVTLAIPDDTSKAYFSPRFVIPTPTHPIKFFKDGGLPLTASLRLPRKETLDPLLCCLRLPLTSK